MDKKKIFIVFLIICIFLSLGMVSASDLSNAGANNGVVNGSSSDTLSLSEDSVVGAGEGTFADLNTLINGNNANEIELLMDYKYSDTDSLNTGIQIDRPLKIIGNGHTIDASFKARIFTITSTVTLENITFINANRSATTGGAILLTGSQNSIINSCTFINNTASNGGAIYWSNGADHGEIHNSTFINNYVRYDGAAVFWQGSDGTIKNTVFNDNTAGDDGGAIFWEGDRGTIYNITCNNNKGISEETDNHISSSRGGTISITGSNILLSKSRFSKSSVTSNLTNPNDKTDGGAIFITGDNVNVTDTTVTDSNSTNYGGAIHIIGNNALIKNCTFEDCTAGETGGIIYIQGNNANITHSNFTKGTAKNGGAIYVNGQSADVAYSNFDSNIADSTGGAIFWAGSSSGDTIIFCNFTNNRAITWTGGALHWSENGNYGLILNSTFVNNYAGFDGGAVDWAKSSNGKIENSSFISNSAIGNGGALSWDGVNGTLENTLFEKNYAKGDGRHANYAGGGAVQWSATNGLFYNCRFINNTSPVHAGVVYGMRSKNLTLNYCVFEDNKATNEGSSGGVFYLESSSNVNFYNTNFTNNEAGGSGGCIVFNMVCDHSIIENCTFKENHANQVGAVQWNINHGLIYNSTFIHNYLTPHSGDHHGGAVTFGGRNNTMDKCNFINNTIDESISHESYGSAVYYSASESKLINTNFTGNSALAGNGALFVTGSMAVLHDLNFYNNTAGTGGAIAFHGKSGDPSNSEIYNCYFENNSAYWGGAIYGSSGSNSQLYNLSFVNNTASQGGALGWTASGVNIHDCNFTNNKVLLEKSGAYKQGGTLYVSGSLSSLKNILINQSYSINIAGAIVWAGSNGNLTNVTIINSTSESNIGGIYIIGSYVNITDMRLINCSSHNSKNGGGGSVYTTGSYVRLENVNITNSYSTTHGGSIYWTGNNGELINVLIENSTASSKVGEDSFGGAIYWTGHSGSINVNVTNSSSFSYARNTGALKTNSRGGAIYITGKNNFIKESNFINCSSYDGGTIYALYTAELEKDECIRIVDSNFINTSAVSRGGAIYSGAYATSIWYCNFTNYSALNGGAIYITASGQDIQNANFNGNVNTDTKCGGGIYIAKGVVDTRIEDSTFKNHYAYNGGAIYNEGSSGASLTILHSTFLNNIVSHNGGAIYYIVDNVNTRIPVTYRDFNNFDERGIITDGRTTLNMTANDVIYQNVIYDSLFKDNFDYCLNVTANISTEAPTATIIISNPKDINKNKFKMVVNLTYIGSNNQPVFKQVVITPSNWRSYYVNNENSFYVVFDRLDETTDYNLTVGFYDDVYLYKENHTKFRIDTYTDVKGDFTILQELIDYTIQILHQNEIYLKRPYIFTVGLDKECMHINETFTIHGNGFYIDALGYCRIFNITADDVHLDGITFINGNASGNNSDDIDKGGALFWAGSNGVLSNSVFAYNNASYGGGVYFNSTASNCKIINTDFYENNATFNGGAIDCNSYRMNLTNTTFEDNYAGVYGAALCREVGATSGLGYNNTFIGNRAEKAGAALAWIRSESISIDKYTFINNSVGESGGAIYVGEDSGNCEILNCVFDSNWVENKTGGHGGAIEWYAENGLVKNSNFTNNYAYDGGAIYVGSDSGNINITGSTFTKNYAYTTGGAMSISASAVTLNESNFYYNIANEGGALYVAGEGTTNYVYSSVFKGNIANGTAGNMDGLGGAIDWIASSGHIYDSNFTSNCADYGGGVYFGGKSDESIINNCIFTDNKAKYDGGAIDCNSSKMYLTNTTFDGNFAQFGAALCRETNAKSGSGENNTFKNNHAVIAGAALGWMGSIGITIKNYTFTNNSADVAGGAIYVSPNSHNCSVIDCRFDDNYVTNMTSDWDGEFLWTAWDGDTMYYRIQKTEDPTLNTTAKMEVDGTTFYYASNEELDAALGTGGAITIFAANATIKNTNFTGGSARLGGAIYVGAYTGSTQINNSIFKLNTAYENGGAVYLHASAVHIDDGEFYYNSAVNGSALYVGGVGTSNKVHESIFEGNNATGFGGGIYWVAFEGEIANSTFNRNFAEYGGGIYLNGRSANTNITNTIFKFNNATKNGGAIECNASNIGIYNLTFESNYAGEYGAALCREIGATAGNGTNNTFKSNHAGISGAALAWMGVKDIHIKNYTFIDNTAERSGGAIYVDIGSDNDIIENCTFEGNHLTNMSDKHNGGAIDCKGDNLTIIKSSFTNNGAHTGGALYVGTDSKNVHVYDSNFTSNYAQGNGGALGLKASSLTINNTIFKSNTAEDNGGALYAGGTGTNNTIHHSSFEKNTAGDHGGAIDWLAAAGVLKYINFIGNEAEYGGAIYLNGVSSNSNLETIYFKENRAAKNGGAIDCNASNMELFNTQFISNYAGEYGAALCREANATGGHGGNNSFIENHADIGGAALAWLGVDGININNYTFINNTAGKSGGAIYVRDDSPNCSVRNSYFDNNYIVDIRNGQGGAISWLGENATIQNTTFLNSFATQGGTLYIAGNNANITQSNFSYSAAFVSGGAISGHNADNSSIIGCIFNKNVGSGYLDSSNNVYGEGGAIYWENATNLNISNTKIFDTESHSNGAVSLINCNDSTIYNVTFSGAITIRNGGSISWVNSTNGTIDSCNFSFTAASYDGGAIFLNNTDNINVSNSYFNVAEALYGNGGGIFVNGNATFNNLTLYNYKAYEDYAGGIFVYGGNSTIANSTFHEPDAIWVNKTATAYVINNTVSGAKPNKNVTYLEKEYDARYNKYDYSVWNDGDLYLENNTFDYIIFNNGTIWTNTTTWVLDNKTWNETWNTTFTFWANITDDNNNTIISVDKLITWNNVFPHAEPYPMSYNAMVDTLLIYQGNFTIFAKDTGLMKNIVHTGGINVKLPTELSINHTDVNKENITFTVKINVPVSSNYTFDKSKVIIKVNGEQIPYANITFAVIGDEWIVAYANFTMHHMPVGTYTISASYLGDDFHWGVENTTSLSLFSRPIWIAVHADSIFWGQTLIVNVTSNATNAEGRIIISINGKEMSVPLKLDKNGSYVYRLPNENFTALLEPGNEQVVSVIFTNDTYWATQVNSSTFNVYKLNTTINATPKDIIFGENEIINVTVNKTATGYIVISIGKNGYLLYLENGTVKFNISGLAPGKYENVTVLYSGDLHFNMNSTNITFTVGSTGNYTMDVKVDNITYGQNATVRVLVPTDASGNVTIYVDGDNKGTVNVTNGVAILDVSGLGGGNHTVNVTYNGCSKYSRGYKNNTNFTVNPTSDWKMGIHGYYEPYGEYSTFNITTDPYNLAVKEVTIIIDGIPYVVPIDAAGNATLRLNNLSGGPHEASVSYVGDANYSAKTQKFSPYIPQATPTITLTQNGTDVIASVSGKVTGNVTFIINDKRYTINLENGNATLENNLTIGNNFIVASYNGDKNYTNIMTMKNFVIDKYNTFVNAIPTNISYLENEIIDVSVNETATGYIVVTIGNDPHLLPIGAGGKVQFNISGLAPGKYENIPVTYSGDDNFTRNSTTISFTVNATKNYALDVKVDNITYGQNATVRVLVATDASGNVTIYVDGDNKGTVILTKGVATLDVADLAGGEHVVNVTYNGCSKYAPLDKNNTKFMVNPTSDWKMGINGYYKPYGEYSTFNITTDPYNLAVKEVTIIIDGIPYVVPIDAAGNATLRLNNLSGGSHEASVSYDGDANYSSKTQKFFPSIPQATPTITLTQNGTDVIASVSGNVTGNVTFTIAGNDYTINLVNGNATLSNKLTIGNNYVIAEYNGDKNYTSVKTMQNFVIDKYNTFVNAIPTNISYLENEIIDVSVNETATGYIVVTIGNDPHLLPIGVDGKVQFNISGLAPGKYENIPVVYSGDDNFFRNSTTISFTVNATKNYALDVKVDNITYGQNATIRVLVATEASGNVTIYVDGDNKGTVNVINGVATLDVAGLAGGEHVVNVTYNGCSKYAPLDKNNTKFMVNPTSDWKMGINGYYEPYGEYSTFNITTAPYDLAVKEVTIIIDGIHYVVPIDASGNATLRLNNLSGGPHEASVSYVGDANYSSKTQKFFPSIPQAVPTITLTQNGTDVIASVSGNVTGNVTFTIAGNEYTINLVNGNATLVNNLTIGNNYVIAEYNGDKNYTNVETKQNFVIEQYESLVNVTAENTPYGKIVEIIVQVGENQTGIVEIVVNGKRFLDEVDSNGIAKFYIDGLNVNQYTVDVTYKGDDSYKSNVNSTKFNVTKATIGAEVTALNVTVKENTSFIITKLNEGFNGNMSIEVDGIKYNGTVKSLIEMDRLQYGAKEATVKFYGDDNYEDETLTVKFNVSKLDTNPFITEIINSTVIVTLPEDATGNVSVVFENGTNKTVYVSNGTATITLNNVTPGINNITVIYSGDENYNNATVNATVDIPKYDSPISVDIIAGIEGELTNITVHVPVNATGTVVVTIDGQNYTKEVDGGKAIFNIENLTAGNKTVVVEYLGDENYNSNYTIDKFSIDAAMIVPEIIVIDQGNGTVVVVVGDNATGNVTITVGNNTYNATVINGTAVVTLDNVTPGINNITVIYSGDVIHTNATVNATVDIPKYDAPISADIITAGDMANITVSVPVNATGTVVVTIDGQNYTKEVDNGKATFTVENLTAGNKTVVVEYLGDENYNSNYTIDKFSIDAAMIVPEIIVIDQGNGTIVVVVGDNATGNVTIGDKTVEVINGTATVTLDNLTPGVNNITVIYSGDDTHTNATVNATVDIPKFDSEISVDIIPGKEGESTNITVSVPVNATGTVVVTIDGQNYTKEVDNGKATFTIDNLSAGNKTVVVEYLGDDNYNSNYTIDKFTIDAAEIVPEIIVIDQGNGTVVVVIGDNATGNVTIGDKTVEVINGTAVVTLDNLTPGINNITVIYSGDDTHNSSTVNATVNVPKYETPINVSLKDINVGDTAVIKVTTPVDATGDVVLEIDGEKYTAPIEDGVATFEIDGLTAGTKTIAIDYAGDDKYLANNTVSKITVSKLDSFIRAEVTDIDVGENVSITVYGPDDATGQVLIDIDGVGYYVNLTNGVGTTEIPRILSGIYNVNITYVGNEKYLSSSNITQFNVTKVPSYVIPSAVNITVGDTEVIRLLVPADATGIVTVVIDGEEFIVNLDDDLLGAYEGSNDYDVVITKGEGMLLISGLPKGQYLVSATYNGDIKYLPSTNQTLFTVGKRPVDLEIIDYGNGTAAVNVSEIDATGNITLEIANKTFNAPIINGTATFDLDGVNPGTYNATAYYPGDDVYEDQTTNGPITIPKVPATIDATGHDINVGETEVITVYLEKDATGEVSVEINGKTYTGTVENGVAKINVPDLSAGDYETVVNYSGDDKYLPASDNVTFSVNKIKPSIIINADDITEGDDAIVIVKLPADATGSVTITINGKQYTAAVVNGIATFTIPGLTKGNYTVSAVYSGDDKYEPAGNATDFEVFSKSTPPQNETANKTALNMEVSKNATGNPILVLLLVLLALGSTQIRRFKK